MGDTARAASPPRRPDTSQQLTPADRFLLALLTNRAERKDTRVYAHAASETQTAITDAYTSRPVSRAAKASLDPGFLEVFPRVSSRPPQLLQELEAVFVDRQRAADKAAFASAVGTQLPKDRDSRLAANLSLDVHRQVFAAFIQGFHAYGPLLAQIHAEFEAVLEEGLRCAHANMVLRQHMAAEELQRNQAGQAIRTNILSEEQEFRRVAAIKLQDAKERTIRFLRRAAATERDLAQARIEQARLQAQVDNLRARSMALSEVNQGEAVWHAKVTSSTVKELQVGPLSPQEEALVESEYVSIRDVKRSRGGGGRSTYTGTLEAYGASTQQ